VDCEQVRDLAPQLALGIADGAERARALRHLADCPDCRRLLEELSEVTDELLLLAPEHEPPAGFETRVLARIQPPRTAARRLRRHRTLLAATASAVVAAAAVTAIMLDATSDDRRLAAQYRGALAEAHGSYFEAGALRAPAGTRAGVVFAYRGSPSWIFVDIDPRYRSGYTVELTTATGRRVALPRLRLDPATGSGGQAIPVDLHQVTTVRLLGAKPGDVLKASIAGIGTLISPVVAE
jgi:hypothetical protein